MGASREIFYSEVADCQYHILEDRFSGLWDGLSSICIERKEFLRMTHTQVDGGFNVYDVLWPTWC